MSKEEPIAGWGNHPVERCHVSEPHSRSSLMSLLRSDEQADYVARGLGRAYGDSSLNRGSGVVVQTRLNRFLSFDSGRGILECEAGVSIAEVIHHLLPRGWFVPVTPGTKHVTIGGAIAADVHGKNHHVDGSFGNYVECLELLTASGEVMTCSPSEHADVFWATVGGMGLTGVILSAKIRLKRIETGYVCVDYRRTSHLEETLDSFTATDSDYQYSVAWIDCLASGRELGRSVVMLANDAAVSQLPPARQRTALAVPRRRQRPVPLYFPGWTLNRWSVTAFNRLYYSQHKNCTRVTDYESFFYPLDNINNWNRIYGRRGFVQYQALFPRETSREGLIEILEHIAASKRASFLAVLKSSGESSRGVLSYLYPGHTLALDLPYAGEPLQQLSRQLDEILLKYGGRLYLAKDALTTADAFAEMYPRLGEFRQLKARLDPNARFLSSQARRLQIVETA